MTGTGYVLSWKSSRVYTLKTKPLYTIFLHSIKRFGHKIGIKIDKDFLAVKQNNCLTKIENFCI